MLDDERDARELVQAILEQGRAVVTLASSASEALGDDSPAQGRTSIVSDIGMPEEDGYAFIRKLRAPQVGEGGRDPAVALTAYARARGRSAKGAGLRLSESRGKSPSEPQGSC